MSDDPKPAHTQGLLEINEYGRVVDSDGHPFHANGVAQAASNHPSRHLAEAEANSRRLVALWNACQALSTEALEANMVERMISALKAVLERDSKWAPSGVKNDCGCLGLSRQAELEYEAGLCPHKIARCLIAQATGQR